MGLWLPLLVAVLLGLVMAGSLIHQHGVHRELVERERGAWVRAVLAGVAADLERAAAAPGGVEPGAVLGARQLPAAVAGLALVDADGAVQAAHPPSWSISPELGLPPGATGEPAGGVRDARVVRSADGRWLDGYLPLPALSAPGAPPLLLHLRYDLEQPRAEIARHTLLQAGGVALAGVVIVLLLARALEAFVNRPVARLGAVVRRVAEGDLSVRSELTGSGELTRLGASLDRMSEALAASVSELRESEARWQFALEGNGDGLWDWSLRTGEVYYSRQWKAMLGLAPGDVGKRLEEWSSRLHPDDAETVLVRLNRHLDGKSADYRSEHRIRHRDGGWLWVLDRGKVIRRDVAGKPLRVIGTLTDITARRQTQEALRASELRWQAALEASRDGVFEHGFGTEGDFYSERMYSMLDYSPVEAPFGFFRARMHPDDGARYDASMAALAAPGGADQFQLECRLRAADGEYRDILIAVRCVERDAGGRALRVVGTHSDISRRKRAERSLRDSEARFRAITEQASDLVVVLDEGGRPRYLGPTMARLLNELFGRASGPGVRGEVAACLGCEQIAETLAALGAAPPGERQPLSFHLEGRDGRRVLLEGVATNLRHEPGVDGIVLNVRDVTERERMRGDLQRAHRMEVIGQLTGGVAHDFNNVLASIMGYTELAAARARQHGDDRLGEQLGEVRRAGERARDLVRQLLAFTRGEEAAPSRIHLATVVEEVVGLLGSVLPSGVRLSQRIEPFLPPVLVNPVQVHQAVMNLAVNARDAMDGTGELTIELGRARPLAEECALCPPGLPPEVVALAVRDSGPGMSRWVRERMFEPYFTTKEPGRGTGMGLALIHGIMQACKGGIQVRTVPGQGTTVSLLFPPCALELMAEPARLAEDAAPGKNEKILVLDDERPLAAYAAEVLRQAGYRAAIASDPQEALRLLGDPGNGIDLFLTDQTMPQMKGTQLVAQLRTQGVDVAAVLCSGYSPELERELPDTLGVCRVLQKPVDRGELLAAVADCLEAARRPGRSAPQLEAPAMSARG